MKFKKVEVYNRCLRILKILRDSGRMMKTGEIAKQIGVNYKLVSYYLVRFSQAGIVSTKVGRKGGYTFIKNPTVGAMKLALDIPILETGCRDVEIAHKRYLKQEIDIDEVLSEEL